MSICFFHQCIKAEITFAKDMKVPFYWDKVRRAQLRVELDAYYARFYCLACDELRCTPIGVDLKEVQGEDFHWGDIPRAEGEGDSAKYHAARIVDSLFT